MNKAVAVVGLVILLAGLALTVVITFLEDWVRVGLHGDDYKACSSDVAPIGTLGLFTATYDPSCVDNIEDPAAKEDASSFKSFPYTESATTEFWPLFPAQTGFGTGQGEFTNCKDYFNNGDYKAIAAGITASQFIPSVNKALVPAYDTLVEQSVGIYGNVSALVAGLWAGQISPEGEPSKPTALVFGLQSSSVGTLATSAKDFGALPVELLVTPTINMDQNITELQAAAIAHATTICSNPPLAGSPAFPDVPSCVGGMTSPVIAMNVAYGDYGQKPIPLSPTLTIAPVTKLNSTDALNAILYDFTAWNPLEAMEVNPALVANLVNIAARLAYIQAGGDATVFVTEPVKSLLQGYVLSGFCAQSGFATFTACAEGAFTDLNEDLAAPWALCSFAAASAEFGPAIQAALTAKETTVCSADIMATVLGVAVETGLLNVTAALKPLVPVLVEAVSTCAAGGYPWSLCLVNPTDNVADQRGVPAKIDQEPYALCLGAKVLAIQAGAPAPTCNSFLDFLGLDARLSGVKSLFTLCTVLSAQNPVFLNTTDCVAQNAAKDYGAQASLAAQALPSFYSNTSTVEEWIARCEEDEIDAQRIEMAQIMIPVAIGVEGVALLVAVAYIISAKKVLGIVSGVLAIIGTGLSAAALALVITAPVYSAVGEPCKDGETCYVSGTANLLGLLAIALPAAGALFLIGSSCCGGSEEDDGRVVVKEDV